MGGGGSPLSWEVCLWGCWGTTRAGTLEQMLTTEGNLLLSGDRKLTPLPSKVETLCPRPWGSPPPQCGLAP